MVTSILSLGALFSAMVYRHILVMSRYPINFISSFLTLLVITVALLFASFMFTTSDVQSSVANATKTQLIGIVVYGILLFLFLSATLSTMGSSIRQEQMQGTLEALYLTPANRFLYLVSRLVQPLLSTLLGATVIILFVHWLFGEIPVHNIGLALITLFLTLIGVAGAGLCFASLTLLVRETSQIVASVSQSLLLVICAMFFPFHTLPSALQVLSYLVPLSYCVDLFRSALLGFPAHFPELAPTSVEILIVVITNLLLPIIGYQVYRRTENYIRSNGSLSYY